MEIAGRMRSAAQKADSTSPREIAEGFAMITRIVSDKRDARETEFGFLDNALFLARKNASHEDGTVREAVVDMLASVGGMNPSWRAAAMETADEIGLQPSKRARFVAERVLEILNEQERNINPS
ncbi:MAG: hypothetical protein LBK91_00820 [Synergistaceae bacterium]|jgi:hypothetical protein|nr:hypothetical protein [Synergistaceae bacterium]